MRSLGLSLLVLLAAQVSNGQESCKPCEPRACPPPCNKTCRYVQEMKKVKKVVWQCKCVDVCIPGRSQEACGKGPGLCPSNGCCDPKASCDACNGSNLVPTCKKVLTKKHLMRCEIEVEVPVWKCVIEDHGNGPCGACGTGASPQPEQATPQAPTAPAPPTPATEGKAPASPQASLLPRSSVVTK